MSVDKRVKNGNKHKLARILTIFLIAAAILFAIFSIFMVHLFSATNLNKEKLLQLSTPALVYNSQGEEISENVQGQPYIKLSNLNDYTIDAFISIEDKDFYTHNGINIKRMFGAMLNNIASGSLQEGASTITQQLIKNTHLTNDKTFERKIKEIILSLKLEKQFSKDEILEMYLNAIYFGNGCYGIENASQFYFGKSASELDINESAILAGIIKSPAYYSPITHKNNIKQRKDLILKEMFVDDAITQTEYTDNTNKTIDLNIQDLEFQNYSAYINSAIEEASTILNLQPNQLVNSKYKIYTYFDSAVASALSESVKNSTNAMTNSIVIDNKSGGVLAFNSSYTFGATNIQRTPASTIKPILVYGAGIEYGKIYPCSILKDNPTTFENDYSPKNISNKYYGNISAELALAKSLNVPAVSLFKEIGIEKCKSFAKKCGIDFDESDNGLALALGAMKYGVTIQSLSDAYLAFANSGMYKNSTFIKRIEDSTGKIVYTHNPTSKRVMSEATAYLVGQMMKKTTTDGTCTALGNLGYEVHAKSGTNGTQNYDKNTDSLCVAQTTSHTACIWYFSKDNNDENLLENANTSQLSPTLKMRHLFEKMYNTNKPTNFTKPNGIVTKEIDALSYDNGEIELATVNTPKRYTVECEFNQRYLPQKVSKNFTNITPTQLIVTYENGISKIQFATLKHQRYELIREEKSTNTKTTLLVVSGKSGIATFTDNTTVPNTYYEYYIHISNAVINDYEYSNTVSIATTLQHTANESVVQQQTKIPTYKSSTRTNYNYHNYFR